MKQVIQSARSGRLAVKDVPAPNPATGQILVRTRASVISAGTERMVVEFAKKSLAGKAQARPDLVKKVLAKAKTVVDQCLLISRCFATDCVSGF